MICALPDGSGRIVAGEDTGQPHPPAGWGVLDRDGRLVGKLVATAAAEVPDPYGCAFARDGRLFTTELGHEGFGTANGQLVLWFPPFDRFPGPPGAYPDDRRRQRERLQDRDRHRDRRRDRDRRAGPRLRRVGEPLRAAALLAAVSHRARRGGRLRRARRARLADGRERAARAIRRAAARRSC